MNMPFERLRVWHDSLVDLCARFLNRESTYRAQMLERAQACFVESRPELCLSEQMDLAKAVFAPALADCRSRVLAPAFDKHLDDKQRVHQLLANIEEYYGETIEVTVVGCLIPVLRQLEQEITGNHCQTHFKLWYQALSATLTPLSPNKSVSAVAYQSLALLQGARLMHPAVWDRQILIKQTYNQLRKWWLSEISVANSVSP